MQLLTLLLLGLLGAALADESELIQEFSVGNHQFTADVYKQLIKSTTGNILVCPVSAETILALTHAGARGETAKQMATGLRLPENPEKIQKIFGVLTKDFRNGQGYVLKSANKVYLKNDFEINQQFKDVAVNVFDADIQNIDFSKSATTASEINRWVSDKTENLIKDLLSPSDINAATVAVLVNALFFHGKWANPFQKYNTAKKHFYINDIDHVDVDMMTMRSGFNYYECSELNAKVLEMPYEGEDVAMTFILPNEKEGLRLIEENLEEVLESPKYTRKNVDVSIPKFEIETSIKFVPILRALGIHNAFMGNADFSGFGPGSLKIDAVIQKNFIEVNEAGTKAASATAVLVGYAAILPPPVEATFVADHPFLYFIKKGNTILFAGSVKQF